MPDGSIIIRCPRCGHPYPMSATQFSVYRGRNMGCMECGRPFTVEEPPPSPPAMAPEAPAAIGALSEPLEPVAGGAESVATAAAAGGGADPQLAGPAPALRLDAPFPPPIQTRPPSGAPAGSAVQPASAAGGSTAARSRPSRLAVAAVAAGVLCPVLLMIACIAGYHDSSEDIVRVARTATPILLIRLASAAAALALIGGAAILLQTRRRSGPDAPAPPRASRSFAAAAAGVGAMELVVVLLVWAMAWPTLASSLAESQKASCQAALQDLGRLLVSQAQADPAGKFPDSLGTLVRKRNFTASSLACPASDDAPASSKLSAAEQADLIDAGKHLSYVYLGKGLHVRGDGTTPRATTQTVLVYEQPGHHGAENGIHVLFADGMVVFVDREVAIALIGELKAGQNPPPSAAGLHR
jgi:hypothetical protein